MRPRQSSSGLRPAQPIATSHCPWRQARPKLSVIITAGATQTKAVILYTSDQQVAAILPSTIPVGNANVTVTFESQTSASATIQVAASAFGIYTFNQAGFGQAVASDTAVCVNDDFSAS
ncbi:MAG: hypothetical protein ABSH36_15460 [Solirubrobacteraceae bacterium]